MCFLRLRMLAFIYFNMMMLATSANDPRLDAIFAELDALNTIKQEVLQIQENERFFLDQFQQMAEFYQGEIRALQDRLAMQESRLGELQQKCGDRPPQEPPVVTSSVLPFSLGSNDSSYFVAFSAVPAAAHHYDDGQRLVFDHVLVNAGRWYSPTTGIFMCPLNGYYEFSVVLFNDFLADIHVQLMKDDEILLYKVLLPSELSTSHSLIVRCRQLETVYLRVFRFSFVLAGNVELPTSSFSGQLLKSGF